MRVEIDGVVLEGNSTELSIILRKPPYEYTMSKIARLLGQTRSNVSRVLQGTGYEGKMKKKSYRNVRLDEEVFRTTLDVEIAARYNMQVVEVKKQRDACGNVRVVSKANIPYRQRLLVAALFGQGYTVGPEFERVLRQVVNSVFRTPRQRKLLLNFYFGNRKTRGPTEKTYRATLRQELKIFLLKQLGPDCLNTLVKRNVLIKK